ncbi:MAG: motility associated factor glycosyltransferase family protein [Treponema sp.]|nr:motility associated factor glycosyltransferase family protein [Treponema sp.]
MGGKFFYSQIILSKDENQIPLCKNEETGQEASLHSKYNPLREAESFVQNIDESCRFFVVLGLCGGYHIEKLLKKCPNSKILVIEKSDSDIKFLSEIKCVKNLFCEKCVKICPVSSVNESILSFYKPALHGNLTILSLRAWENAFESEAKLAREKINESIKLLAGDFSVQSHFGKIWQKNILTNLKILGEAGACKDVGHPVISLGTNEKIAAVIAAGPSLNETISELKNNRKKYFIIATDTAFSSLTKQNVFCDAVVSIDGQNVSHEHYLEKLGENTIYAFDLCASPSSVRKALKFSRNVLFFESGHPLSQYASFFDSQSPSHKNFIHLEAGSGTVTIAAASLASVLGFSELRFFGADFSYIKGSPYARGTYLESKFYSNSNRFNPAEKTYSALMFRTELKRLDEKTVTTEILESYKNSLEEFMKKRETLRDCVSQNDQKCKQNFLNEILAKKSFDYESFISKYCKELKESFKDGDFPLEDTNASMTLLPYLAKVGKNFSFVAYLKKLEYNKNI